MRAGLLHRFPGPTVTIDPGPHELVIPLGAGAVPGASFAYPLELFAVDLAISLPEDYRATDATVTVHDVAAAATTRAWRPVPLDLADGWRTHGVGVRQAPADRRGAGRRSRADRGRGPAASRLVARRSTATAAGSRSTFAPAAVGRGGHGTRPIIAYRRPPRGDREQAG